MQGAAALPAGVPRPLAGRLPGPSPPALGPTPGPQRASPAPALRSDRDFTADDYEALRALDEGLEDRRGADPAAIRALPVERAPRGGGPQPDRCVVCLEDVRPGARMKRLPCGHAFHPRCIDRWLRARGACPICQLEIGGGQAPAAAAEARPHA